MSTSKILHDLRWAYHKLDELTLDNPQDRLTVAEIQLRLDDVVQQLDIIQLPIDAVKIDPETEMTRDQAKMYVRKVLSQWPAFCKHHSRFAKAMRALLRDS